MDPPIRDSEHASPPRGDIDARIGGRIRALRDERGESLRAFALRCGVSSSMLSDVERGLKSPTISILSAIAEGLAVPLSRLVSDEQPLPDGPRVVRAADILAVVDPETGVERSHLGPLAAESKVEFVRIRLPGRSTTGCFSAHPVGTIERVYAVAGTVDVTVAGKTCRLGVGDAVLYRAAVVHALGNAEPEPAEALLVVERP